MNFSSLTARTALAAVGLAFLAACNKTADPLEDRADGRRIEEFPEVTDDLFKAMDGGIQLTADEVRGRNMWILWTAGNEQFWDRMARESHGLVDLLKTLDSRRRGERFKELGLINEPGFRKATKPDEFGLWLDERVEQEPPGIDPVIYGRSSGVMGFRLFANPDFTPAARQAWSAERYEKDAAYAADPRLVRPYRVGITCGACHIGLHPLNPPTDPENPRWENLASTIGNQYLREGRVFAAGATAGGFFREWLEAQPPGTSDTSRIVNDHLDNPGAINPIFLLGAREAAAQPEAMHADFMLLPHQRAEMKVPRLSYDTADCIGLPGITLRWYVNMGMFHQHWLRLYNPLVGLSEQKPFSIKAARKHSHYWNVTEEREPTITRFLRRLPPLRLADAPGGRGFIDPAKVPRGRFIFSQHCATCHSNRQPPQGADSLDWFAREFERPDFLAENSFADEKRYAINDIKTNSAAAFASNGRRGAMWDVFTSEIFKTRGSIGEIDFWNVATEKDDRFMAPAGGPGHTRPTPLLSLWTSAPFFHNNALGKFTGDPTVKGRMEAFEDAAEKLLWPEKRLGHESIRRTREPSMLELRGAAIPEPFHSLLAPHFDADGRFRLGPIPAGTPIGLFTNVNPELSPTKLVEMFVHIRKVLRDARERNLDAPALAELVRKEIAPRLLKASKCPDFVQDRGHTYGHDLPESDKRALIEFLKTI
jgi:hypothetical protein